MGDDEAEFAVRKMFTSEEWQKVPEGASLVAVEDFPVPMGNKDRAKKTIPRGVLEFRQSQIYGIGVFTTSNVSRGVQLGPYEGQITRVETTNGYSFKLRQGRLIDAADETVSNWMRYVNCARNIEEQNVAAFQHKGCLFYRTCKDIRKDEELLVSYGTGFSEHPEMEFFEPNTEEINLDYYSCRFCCMGFGSETCRSSHEEMCVLKPRSDEVSSERETNSSCTKKDEQMYYCNHCGYGTKTKSALKNHIMARHTRENANLFACDKCDFSTYYQNNLSMHLRIHSEDASFKCAVFNCQKSFTRKMKLESHILRFHEDLHDLITSKIHKCKLCKFTTLRASILHKHSRFTHSEKNKAGQRYQCEKCEFGTNRRGDLRRHLFKHSNPKLKPHVCTSCKKGFASKQGLDSHILNNHNDEADLVKTISNKIHQCPDCQYRSFSSTRFNAHRTAHQ